MRKKILKKIEKAKKESILSDEIFVISTSNFFKDLMKVVEKESMEISELIIFLNSPSNIFRMFNQYKVSSINRIQTYSVFNLTYKHCFASLQKNLSSE